MKFLQIFLISTTLAGLVWLAWQLLDILRQWFTRKRRHRIPEIWPLGRRPVLNARERHVFAVMRQAFPQHEILVKLPLTRFTQLRDTSNAAFWYELLTPLTVTFTLCDANTQVFAVLDMLNEGRTASSATRLKQRALEAAQVRYVRLDLQTLPTVRLIRDLILSDKEQRDSLWRMSTGTHPATAPTASTATMSRSGPDSRQPAMSEALRDQKAQLQRQVQAQRDSRRMLRSDPAHVDVDIGAASASSTAAKATKPFKDLRQFSDSRSEANQRRFNPDTIRGRDSFLTPDSRGLDNYRFREGTVMPYTTRDNTSAEHVWLDSKASSAQDKK